MAHVAQLSHLFAACRDQATDGQTPLGHQDLSVEHPLPDRRGGEAHFAGNDCDGQTELPRGKAARNGASPCHTPPATPRHESGRGHSEGSIAAGERRA